MPSDSPTFGHPPLIARAFLHPQRVAIIDATGSHTYADLLAASARVAINLLAGRADLDGARVAFLVGASFDHVAIQWGIWRAGGVAVPLCTMHPPAELDYVIADADAETVIAGSEFEPLVRPLAEKRKLRFLSAQEASAKTSPGAAGSPAPLTQSTFPGVDPARPAMLVYTSGTTSKPKGVVSTHAMIAAQIEALVEAWAWTADDRILHVLPLHHVHGIINVLCCAMWAGATCEMAPGFDAAKVWGRLVSGELTLFMAVPTIYARLVAAWESADESRRRTLTEGCARLRLMVSGSAALPVSTLEKWRTISGHTLLERYGMTEIGMALSNPLVGERVPGHVGSPLPRVEVRLVDGSNMPVPDGEPGEIQVRGPNVFRDYWRKPEASAAAFIDGWFRTGDVAVRERGIYRILGRNSVDIIKTGGYKVSALEIEEVLRTHEAVDQCAVVGVEDAEWGERVGAAIVFRKGQSFDLNALRAWAKNHLAVYKVPSRLLVLPALPVNAMGKVTKPDLVKQFAAVEKNRE
ncbi:MAG: acyl-CoA synthetase [Planctomycetota bacterium]|nr:acyl-CoA synthetase [Planctomycetota bacterium]